MDLLVIPLTLVLSVPALVWFGHHWTVIGTDAGRYLYAGSQLILGEGFSDLDDSSHINHGPGFPVVIGALILLFGRDTEVLAWAVRLMALVNPLLAYLLARRISGPVAGLIAAAALALFGYNVKIVSAFNIDSVLLTFYLLSLLALLAAIDRNGAPLAALSGVLLGASILTKETAFANLPLTLIAVLLLDWDLRAALWHYLGLVLVCLPWWIWVWSATGEVYLVDRLPVSSQVPILLATTVIVGLAAGAYVAGTVDRFLAGGRRRRWTGRIVVTLWTVALFGLLLATATPALSDLSFEELRSYLAELLAPNAIVLPVLLLVGAYVIWKVFSQNMPWKLLSFALLFQMPVCVLVTVEGWASRQFLVPQTLLFCAGAALVVEAGGAAWRGRGYTRRIVGAAVAISLVILLVASSVERVRALLPEDPGEIAERHQAAPQAAEMIDWMDENIPEGKHILVTPAYSLNRYLVFLDGGRHEWTFLRLDQEPCEPRPNVQTRCTPQKNAVSRIPPEAVWVQMIGRCKVVSLSMPNLLKQVRQTDSDYVMISGSYAFPGILQLPSRLQESGAFELIHSEFDHGGSLGAKKDLVLLKSTGRAPRAVPAQMNANTVLRLKRCEQANGPGYADGAHLRESSQPYSTGEHPEL